MSIADKLDRVLTRAEELKHQLATADGGQFGTLSKELSELEPLVERVSALRAAERARDEAEAMLGDPELKELAEAEYLAQRDRVPVLEREVRLMLLPRDSADERSAILEVRPAAGGDEAALFAAELFRAYQRYAEARRWKFEVLDYDESDLGGVKGAVAEIQGRGVFARVDIPKGTRLIEYTGERITNAEADRRYEDELMGRHHTFLFILNTRTVIDAAHGGNISKYINH